jgi:hypothetical protein
MLMRTVNKLFIFTAIFIFIFIAGCGKTAEQTDSGGTKSNDWKEDKQTSKNVAEDLRGEWYAEYGIQRFPVTRGSINYSYAQNLWRFTITSATMNTKAGEHIEIYTSGNKIINKNTEDIIYTFTRIPLSEYQQAYDDAVASGVDGADIYPRYRLDAALVHTPIDFITGNTTVRLWREPETWPTE